METCVEEKYDIRNILAQGGFAQVYIAVHKKTGTHVAIKQIPKQKFNDENEAERIKSEIRIHSNINHPFIVEVYEVIETEKFAYIVMELAKNGSLTNYLSANGHVIEREACRIFAQIVVAIRYLHTKCRIAHRDIKLDNILVDSHNNIRLSDFGLSRAFSSDKLFETLCGSLCYAAPEIMSGRKYDFSADIWALGVCLYALVTGKMPFYDMNITKLGMKIVYTEPDFPSDLSDNLSDLLSKLLAKDPKDRLTIEEIYQHPWLTHELKLAEFYVKNCSIDTAKLESQLASIGISVESTRDANEKGIINEDTVIFRMIKKRVQLQPPERRRNYLRMDRNGSCPNKVILPPLFMEDSRCQIRKSLQTNGNGHVICSQRKKTLTKIILS